MQLSGLTSTVVLCVLLTAGCGVPKELSRSKALALLQSAPPDVVTDALWAGLSNFQGRDFDCKTRELLAFAENLGVANIISATATPYPAYDQYRPGGTIYEFRLVDTTNATAYGPANTFVMGRARPAEVTGIRHEGIHAVADTKVAFEPTPIYQALTSAPARLSNGSPQDQACAGVAGGLYKLPESEERAFRFQRYDDGWRLTEELR